MKFSSDGISSTARKQLIRQACSDQNLYQIQNIKAMFQSYREKIRYITFFLIETTTMETLRLTLGKRFDSSIF